MEPILMFKQIRDACDAVVKAFESNSPEAIELAIAHFVATITKLDLWK